MKRIYLLNLVAVVVFMSFVGTSCKKTVHPTHPTPANNRLASYTKFSTNTIVGSRPVTETFTFFYNDDKRVSQILYSTDDSMKVVNGIATLSITFSYVNNNIFKTITSSKTSIVLELDTFVQNSSGLITKANVPDGVFTWDYLGVLMTRATKTVSDSGTSITATSTYTSDNGDLLNHVYDETLTFHFGDSGLSYFGGVAHDTDFTPPFSATYTDFGPIVPAVTTHAAVGTYTDVLTNYTSGGEVAVTALDHNGVYAYDTLYWPGGLWKRESFFVYPDLDNRTGDILQIESFTTFGTNIFRNKHLVKQLVNENGPTNNITYTIDADGKITQTYAKTTDQYFNQYTTIYKLQYEVY